MIGGGPYHRKAGGVTDDTLQAVAVACSLIERHRFDPEDLMSRLIEVYHQNPDFFGPTSSAVFEEILGGTPLEQAARRVHEAGGSRSNGSVMRGPPLGLYFRESTQVRVVSLACSRLTHYDVVTGECSAAINVMVSRMSRGASPQRALQEALQICENSEVRGMLSRYWDYPVEPSLDALLTTHAAVSLFLGADSFEQALITAVNQGGDADTVGALTGALAGAYWGVDSIPIRWLDRLQNADEIHQVAYRLWISAQH
jgi:ADP-ribosyl-[dinitrogen reductase] hydrolase